MSKVLFSVKGQGAGRPRKSKTRTLVHTKIRIELFSDDTLQLTGGNTLAGLTLAVDALRAAGKVVPCCISEIRESRVTPNRVVSGLIRLGQPRHEAEVLALKLVKPGLPDRRSDV